MPSALLTFLIGLLFILTSSTVTAEIKPFPCNNYCMGTSYDYFYPKRCNNMVPALITVGAIYGTIGTICYFSWYKDARLSEYRYTNERWFEADTYAGGTDKLGHAYSNYILVRGTSAILQWGGVPRIYAPLYASALALTYFTAVEVKDGFGVKRSDEAIIYDYEYGFSWQDFVADVAGELLAILFVYFPTLDEMFDYRLEYWPSPEYIKLFKRGDPNFSEDYSGMSYALWFHLNYLPTIKCSDNSAMKLLKYIDLGIGYRTEGYLPPPEWPCPHRRQLYFGIALNLQKILDDAFFCKHPNYCITRNVSRCLTEVLTLPGTAIHLGTTWESQKN